MLLEIWVKESVGNSPRNHDSFRKLILVTHLFSQQDQNTCEELGSLFFMEIKKVKMFARTHEGFYNSKYEISKIEKSI